MTTPAISVVDVAKRFAARGTQVVALERTSLDVAPLQIVSIVGPSGCGKTTLLNLIAGFTQPTQGRALVGGRPVERPGADRAVVFQADAVFPWLTVRDNLSYGPRVRGLPRTQWQGRVDRFMALVGLNEFADAYPKQLSGGMRKRVDLARAYVNDPDVLLLDEPFGALDVFTKEAMQQALLRIAAEEPKTIVFITHDIEEAIFVSDRVVVMTPRPGRVAADIPVTFSRPRSIELRAEPAFQRLRLEIAGLLIEREAA
ncbi:MAG: ABC transporter ATP-binding protein [Chloroflexota bacterium]|nr:ABC transporter ATP-binding protein [Chloroflexota bacterium]